MADGGLILPGPKREAQLGIVHCAADDCDEKGLALPGVDAEGAVFPEPPYRWGAIDALGGDGSMLRLFVCSPACERRLAQKLAGPRLGSLEG